MNRRALLAMLLLLLVPLIGGLTLTGPSWSPSTAYTNSTLACSWSFSGDALAQNITVLRSGTVFNSTYQNASLVTMGTSTTVEAANTTKGEIWSCRIILYNETTSTQGEANVTILNSPPTTEGTEAGIFNDSNADVGFLAQVLEDTTLSIDVNATDADGDVLTYLAGEEFCTRISSSAGTYTCSPAQSDISNNSPTQVNITFTVTDGQNVGGRTITFNITPVNDAPSIAVSDQATAVNASLNMTFAASDEESNFALSFALIFNSSNSEIQDRLSLAKLNVNGTNISVYYDASSPDFNDVGAWPVFINVTDNSTGLPGTNRSATYEFTLNLTASGRKPHFTNVTSNLSASAGPYNITQGQSIQINVSANDADANSTITFLDDTAYFAIATVKSDTNLSDAIGQVNYTPANDQVGVFNVTVTIQDQESLTNTTVLQFNVTNLNDAPSVNEVSASAANTQNNTNASNLTAYANAPFVYDVNATDPDTIHGDTLDYADNASLFVINATSGRISFTPLDADIGTYDINVTVTDDAGLNASRTLVLTVLANSPPFFNATLSQLNCSTNASCVRHLGEFADDSDAGDSVASFNLTFTSGNLSSLSYNETTGVINFTPQKEDVGNYTVNVTITDLFGSQNSTLMNLSVNNTPVPPNLTRYNLTGEAVVETHLFTYELRATDDDFLVSSANENVTFTTNLSLSHTMSALSTQNTTARALLSFTPADGTAGNYTVEINATDSFGLVNTRVVTFEVFEDVPPPNITNVTPWGAAPNYTIQTTFNSTSAFPGGNITVNASENSTIVFAAIVDDTRPLTYNWTVNGVQNATSQNLTLNFTLFSNGTYEVALNVSNDRFEHSTWAWHLLVQNFNRAPVVVNALPNRTINTTDTTNDYFVGTGASTVRFYDPDDDANENGFLDGNETNRMTFSTASSCSVATIGISGTDLVLTPVSVGTCNVRFNATDPGGLKVESNLVVINVTDVPAGDTETETVTSSGGGGGSSITSRFIPTDQNRKNPEAFHLIAPRLVTIYQNDTLVIPITINNTWEGPLSFVRLWAEANASMVDASFDQDLFEQIPANESREVTLTVTNYRFGDNYEVIVHANVSEPAYEDEAMILLNSIEQSSEGEEVEVKVTFANDLLNQHPECQELKEILDEAQVKLAQNDLSEANRLVDSVINGCRYLVSTQQKITERPGRINPVISIDDLSLRTMMWAILAFVVLLSVALITYYHYTSKSEEDF